MFNSSAVKLEMCFKCQMLEIRVNSSDSIHSIEILDTFRKV